MAKLKRCFCIVLTILVMLSSISFFGCAQEQSTRLYFNFGNQVQQSKMQYKTVSIGEPVGELPLTTPDGKEIDFWVYEGKTINKDTIWWYRKDIVAKAICLEENQYLCLFDLDGGVAPENFITEIVRAEEDGNIAIERPTREIYNFLGWVEKDGDTPVKDLVIDASVKENKFYKAVWERNYSVTINLWSKCEEDTLLDYIYFYWRYDIRDPESNIPCWFELKKGETLYELSKKPTCKELAFKFECWVWQKDTTVKLDENTIFNEDTFGKEKDIVIIIKSQHNYSRPY